MCLGALVTLIALYGAGSNKVEYVRTLTVALLLWTPWHSEIGSVSYTDELNEARLAQLGRWWLHHGEVVTVDHLNDLFLVLPRQRVVRSPLGGALAPVGWCGNPWYPLQG